MRDCARFVFLLSLLFVLASSSHALPRFALVAGAKCGSCHVNPTGGQMRTEYATKSFSVDALPIRATRDEDFGLDTRLSESITIGGDYRSQFIYDSGTETTTFHAMTASLYGTVALTRKITFYVKYDVLNSSYGTLSGPEVYGIARILPGTWYIKGGSFLPDYGWRLDDHTSYVRGGDLGFIPDVAGGRGLIFLPNYKDIGAEIGGNVGPLMITAALLNGTGNFSKIDFSDAKAIVGKIEFAGTTADVNVRVGASGYKFSDLKMFGLHAGVGMGDFVVLGEIDWAESLPYSIGLFSRTGVKSMAGYLEGNFRAFQGLWLVAKYDVFDPRVGWSNESSPQWTPNPARAWLANAVSRLTFGVEFFPYPYIELRPQYRINLETPSYGNDQLLAQVHIWF
jgi:hypothetical protein